MKAAKKVELEVIKVESKKWQSPLDISKYNRSPYLTKSETEEIKFILAKNKKWYKKSYKVLERLITPVSDALEVTQASQSTRSSIIKILLVEIDKK